MESEAASDASAVLHEMQDIYCKPDWIDEMDSTTTKLFAVVDSWDSFGAPTELYLDFAVLVIETYNRFDDVDGSGLMQIDENLDTLLPGFLHRRVEDEDGDFSFRGCLVPRKDWLRARHLDNSDTREAFDAAMADVRDDGCNLRVLPENLSADLRIVVAALEENEDALQFVPEGQLNDLQFLQGLFRAFPRLRLREEVLDMSELAEEISVGATEFGVSEAVYALSRPPLFIQVQTLSFPDDFGVCTLVYSFGVGGMDLQEVRFHLSDISWHDTGGLRRHVAQGSPIDDFVIQLNPAVVQGRTVNYLQEPLTVGNRTEEAMVIDPVDAGLWAPYQNHF
jgi:hypothetical protein